MNRINTFTMIFCLLLVLGMGISTTAWGQCQSNVSCSAADDSNNPVCTTGAYDPCDNNVWWTFSFSRTSETSGNPILRLNLIGTSIDLTFEQDEFSPYTDYSLDSGEWIPVGPSTSHELRLTRVSGAAGSFEDLEITATYRASSGS